MRKSSLWFSTHLERVITALLNNQEKNQNIWLESWFYYSEFCIILYKNIIKCNKIKISSIFWGTESLDNPPSPVKSPLVMITNHLLLPEPWLFLALLRFLRQFSAIPLYPLRTTRFFHSVSVPHDPSAWNYNHTDGFVSVCTLYIRIFQYEFKCHSIYKCRQGLWLYILFCDSIKINI